MKIAVIGAGYVGLVVSVCFAYKGHQVICLEKDLHRCNELSMGHCPIMEKKLPDMLSHAVKSKNLYFTTKASEAIPTAEIIFFAVGTPSNNNGEADLSILYTAINDVIHFLKKDQIVVIKSSIPPGTTIDIYEKIKRETKIDSPRIICNPEFLREGTAVDDFLCPDRLVIGTEDNLAGEELLKLYRTAIEHTTVEIRTSFLNAELIKYASNSYLAVRLSFVNELAGLCEKIGGSIHVVTTAMGLDHRIGIEYLSAGLGYGGACLPKDTVALATIGRKKNNPLTVLESAINANQYIPSRLATQIAEHLTPRKTIGVWGISFKPGTDDIRNSPVLSLLREVQQQLDCYFRVYEPTNRGKTADYPKDLRLFICTTAKDAAAGADALIIGTAWPQFKKIEFQSIASVMIGKNIFDFSHSLEQKNIEHAGLIYHTCGEV